MYNARACVKIYSAGARVARVHTHDGDAKGHTSSPMDCVLVGHIITRVEKWTVEHARSLLFFDSSSGRRPLTRCGRSRLGGPHRLGRPWRGARRLLLCGCGRGRGSCRDNGPRRRGPRGHGGGPAVPARFHAEEGDCVRVAVDVVVPEGKLAARNGHTRPRVGEAGVSDVGARATCAARHGAVLPDFFREVVARAITPRGELGARVSITGCVQLQSHNERNDGRDQSDCHCTELWPQCYFHAHPGPGCTRK